MSDVPTTVTEPKVAEVAETPAAVTTSEEPIKNEETPAVTETSAVAVDDTPAVKENTEEKKEKSEAKAAEPDKKPGILAKLVAPFNKLKVPRSPTRKEKKKEETVATEEVKAKEETPAVPVDAAPEPPKEVVEQVEEAQKPADVPVVDERKQRFGRRLSARVGDLFKPRTRQEVSTTAKVDEHPPIIDQHKPVAPLENPASEGVPSSEPIETKPEPVLAATPIVAAAA